MLFLEIAVSDITLAIDIYIYMHKPKPIMIFSDSIDSKWDCIRSLIMTLIPSLDYQFYHSHN